jgi:hypothetical protein
VRFSQNSTSNFVCAHRQGGGVAGDIDGDHSAASALKLSTISSNRPASTRP